MTTTVAIFGAGGTMGTRVSRNLADHDEYELLLVEPDDEAAVRIRERGDAVTPGNVAAAAADVALLAVPDRLIGDVCEAIVPRLEDGTLVLLLDPAAAHAGALPDDDGVAYVVTHPCHPHLFETPPGTDAGVDWFGGQGEHEQPLVCALHDGPEAAYERGESLVRAVFAPVSRVHRVSVEEMAILEPALVENLLTPFLLALRDGVDEAVELGVPREAAEDMLFGHMRTQLAMVFGWLDHPLSEGAELAVERGRERALADGWRELLTREAVRRHCAEIAALE